MKRTFAVLAPAFIVTAALGLTLPHAAAAQVPDCPNPLQKPTAHVAPSFELRTLSVATVAKLRGHLKDRQWANAVAEYATQYQPQLPDWVVYIDEKGEVYQCVIADNRAGKVVRGKRFIWAIVFSERPMAGGEAAVNRTMARLVDSVSARLAAVPRPYGALVEDLLRTSRTTLSVPVMDADTIDLRLARRNVVFPKDPVLLTIIKALAKGFSFDAAAPAALKFDDSVRTIDLRQVSNDDNDPMWVGFGRIGLAEGALTELSLSPGPGKSFPSVTAADAPLPLERIYTHVVDVKQHTFEIGLIAGMSWEPNVPTYDSNLRLTGRDDAEDFGAYATLFANLPARWAWIPVPWSGNPLQHMSIGGFIGTNVLTGSLGDQLIVGASLGHLWSDAGLSVGRVLTPVKEIRGSSLADVHRWRWLVGIDLRM